MGFIPEMKGWFNILKSISIMYSINKLKNKTTYYQDIEKVCDKIQHPIKALKRPGREGKFLNLRKDMYEKTKANIIYNGKRLNSFSLRSGTRQ